MTFLLLALIPALAILLYYYFRDRRPEPWLWVAAVFALGALSTLAVYPLQVLAQSLRAATAPGPRNSGDLFIECLLIPGLMEEAAKMLVVVLAVYWRADFDEPVDGLVYGIAAALGFTFAEDFYWYVFRDAGWTRVLSAMAHPWFSCFWAAALGWSKFHKRWQGMPLVLGGLLAAAFVHGLYDFLILASADPNRHWLRHILVPLLVAMAFVFEHMLERAQDAEPGPPDAESTGQAAGVDPVP
jgi:RsiW-degrading membrane proteinase PrsW (M82 family)